MEVRSSRFGRIQIREDEKVSFPEGILGFESLRSFAILDDPEDDVFLWLQSVDDENVALPLIEPELLGLNSQLRLTKTDLATLGLTEQSQARYYLIITIPSDIKKMTANVKAPIVVNVETKVARQCVMQENDLSIKESIFDILQKKLAASPNWAKPILDGITVRLSSVSVKPPESNP
ncbi:MAG: flagellar assembly protein FliW [Bdellovibrionales bacterium CG10_big_fil_rev_8_21_14_0_10_45_34]|nr:MAG: flagellar assembly protein FliW [Bdellovibrionales bacterium CG10_big_fil_rev_8_21_14_0_10_45_34]